MNQVKDNAEGNNHGKRTGFEIFFTLNPKESFLMTVIIPENIPFFHTCRESGR